MLGPGVVTVNGTPLLGVPATVTITLPLVAPLGTGTTMLVELQLVGVPATVLKTTVLVPWLAPKFVPVIVTEVPSGPEVGLMLLMLGAGMTVKVTPLLATPPTVTTTGPVVAPVGTGTMMVVEFQFCGVAMVPLKATVLVPCEAPKLFPVTVITTPTAPVFWLKLVIVGPVVPAEAALNAPKMAPQTSEVESVADAEAAPAAGWMWSSVISLVFGAAGTTSSMVYPVPAVKVCEFVEEIAPRSKSPFAVVFTPPLLGLALLAVATIDPSSEFDVATPEYSMTEKRSGPETVSDTVTVFAPPLMFSV